MKATRTLASLLAACALWTLAPVAQAQVPQYGPNVTIDQARRAMAGAIAEARRQGLPMAVAIVDNAGLLVLFERMDNTQTASVEVAQDKARSSAMYRRSTKVFQDGLAAAGPGLRILTLRGANAAEGGVPIVIDGRIIGGLGVSGGTGEQDGSVAKAGLDALAK